MPPRRILGIDPGSKVTGYGIVEEQNGKMLPITYGVYILNQKYSFSKRLHEIYVNIDALIHDYHVTEMAIENVFFSKNVSSSIKLGHARASAMIAAAKHELEVFEYSATRIKQALVGYGRSTKEQIQKMVLILLGLTEKTALDASDALAVAVCHLNSIKFQDIQEAYDRLSER